LKLHPGISVLVTERKKGQQVQSKQSATHTLAPVSREGCAAADPLATQRPQSPPASPPISRAQQQRTVHATEGRGGEGGRENEECAREGGSVRGRERGARMRERERRGRARARGREARLEEQGGADEVEGGGRRRRRVLEHVLIRHVPCVRHGPPPRPPSPPASQPSPPGSGPCAPAGTPAPPSTAAASTRPGPSQDEQHSLAALS